MLLGSRKQSENREKNVQHVFFHDCFSNMFLFLDILNLDARSSLHFPIFPTKVGTAAEGSGGAEKNLQPTDLREMSQFFTGKFKGKTGKNGDNGNGKDSSTICSFLNQTHGKSRKDMMKEQVFKHRSGCFSERASPLVACQEMMVEKDEQIENLKQLVLLRDLIVAYCCQTVDFVVPAAMRVSPIRWG